MVIYFTFCAPSSAPLEMDNIKKQLEKLLNPELSRAIGKLNLILLGPPGSGKGTQADLLEKEFALFHFSTGEMFREAVRLNTPLGNLVKEIMAKGALVSDEILYDLVKEKIAGLSNVDCGILFDGYPRTRVQAQQLDEILTQHRKTVNASLFIDVEEDTLVKRLSGRLYCPQCEATYNIYFKPPLFDNKCDSCGSELQQRREDKPEVIRERLRLYQEQTYPIMDYYKSQGKLWRLPGDDSVGEVFLQICNLLVKLVSKNEHS